FGVWRIAQIGDRLRDNQTYLKLALQVNDLYTMQEQLSRVVAQRKEKTVYWRKARLERLADARKLAQQVHHHDFLARLRALEATANLDELVGADADAGDATAQDKLEKHETKLGHDVRNLRIDVNELVEQVSHDIE